MKKLVLFLMLCVGMLVFAGVASAVSFDATVTADNYYAIYVGNESGVDFIGRNELNTSGDPGTYNWTLPEEFTFDVSAGDYIYVAGWSDNSVAQGWIGEFVSSSYTLLSNTTDWEVFLTYSDLGNGSSAPTVGEFTSDISGATWSAVPNSLDNGSSPWGTISEISEYADWIWGSQMIGGSGYGEYQVFRTQVAPVPEPTTILLSGIGLLGMGAYLRRRRGNK